MMTCETAELFLDTYLAGALPLERRAEVDAHLRACETCRARVNEFAALDDFLSELPRAVVPTQLSARIQQQVRAHAKQRHVGHALSLAFVTLCSSLLFAWMASDTWDALQDRVAWEYVSWLLSVPEVFWRHPSEMLAGFADFAPLSRIILTTASALTTAWLLRYMIAEFRPPMQRLS